MTQTTYGWIVLKSDGTPLRHAKTDALAIFEEQSLARRLSLGFKDSSVVPCTIAYEV